MQSVLLDLDGVIYQNDHAIAGAAEVVAELQRRATPHLFLTNTTSRPRQSLVDKLGSFGIETDAEQLLTPPVAAARWLQDHHAGQVALFVPEATRADFGDITLLPEDTDQGADAVVIGDLGEEWSYHRLNRAFRLLKGDPPPHFLALGLTRFWQAHDGLRLDVGAFSAALEFASGRAPLVLGKPAKAFFEVALNLVGNTAERTLMIGDDVQSDVLGADTLGMQTVLVRTGKCRPEDEARVPERGQVIGSIADLPDLLGW